MLALPRNPEHIMPLLDTDFWHVVEENPGVPHSYVDCITCDGTGYFRWYDDNGVVDNWECDCREQYKLHMYLLNSGIPLIYQRLSWRDADAVEPGALTAALEWRDDLTSMAHAGIGLVLHGEMGAGKSMLGYLLVKAAIAGGFSAQALTFQAFLDRYTQGWSNTDEGRAAKAWFERRITHADVLFLDDLAREYAGRSKVAEAALDYVLRIRVAASRPTLITSNKTLPELSTIYSSNALSLLSECSLVYAFTGEDYRPRAAKRRITEAKAGLVRPVVL